MHRSLTRRAFLCRSTLLAAAGAGLRLPSALASEGAAVVVEPKELDGPLVNPGIGLETFNRFNRRGAKPQSAAFDPKDPPANYPVCSLAYFRLWWQELEPKQDAFNIDRIASLLKQARADGQDLALRFMPWFPMRELETPEWFKRQAARFFRCRFRQWQGPQRGLTERDYWAPDFNDAWFLDRTEALVQAFGEKFDGHPDLAYLDIGSVGNWGEWHTSNTEPPVPMLTEHNARRIIDTHFRHWRRTPLVFNLHHSIPPGLRHAIGRGAGWRTDGNDVQHIWDKLNPLIREDGLRDAWERGPVTGEPVQAGILNPPETFAQALAWHASSFNAKSQPIPDAAVPHVETFLKRCGYRLVLRRLEHPPKAAPAAALRVRMEFENVGVAPPYKNYVLALRLQQGGRSVVLDTDAKLRSWLPGRHRVEASLALPADLPRGRHQLALGVLDPHYREAEVQLASAGRAPDGWHRLSEIEIS